MELKQPVVSVVIPAFRCKYTIEKALETAFFQDIELEVILIDDHSPEDISSVILKYMNKKNFHYIRKEKNEGVAAARNLGVSFAKGRYVAFLDADDWWEKNKLKKQIEMLEKKEVVLCCTARELMNEKGQSTGKIIPVKEDFGYRDLLMQNLINCSSVLLKTEVIKEFPMTHDDSHEDYITWIRILKKYKKACGINEPLLKYRLTDKGKSGNKWNSAKMTYRVFRYAGFGTLRSLVHFFLYAVNGVLKYYF